MGDAFVNLTNPVRNYDHNPDWEWPAIVLSHLCGLIVLEGVVITIIINWVSNRKSRHLAGEARYDYVFTRPHAVVLGGHPITPSIAKDLIESGENEYVVIQTMGSAEALRKKIDALVKDEKKARNVIIYTGSRTSPHELEELHLPSASEIYIIGETEEIDGNGLDSLNMECWNIISHATAANKNGERINCHVMFEHESSLAAFQFTDIDLESSIHYRFLPFGLNENRARQLLTGSRHPDSPHYSPLDGEEGISFQSSERVHLIIIGMNEMGKALAIEAAHVAHYPNFANKEAGNPRTLITFIDPEAELKTLQFVSRFSSLFQLARWRFAQAEPDLSFSSNCRLTYTTPGSHYKSPYSASILGSDLIDMDFEFIQGDSSYPSIRKYIAEAAAESKTTIAVCVDDSSQAISTALSFSDEVYEKARQIWVYQKESGALANAISHGKTGLDKGKFNMLRPFGMLDDFDYTRRVKDYLPMLIAYSYSHGTADIREMVAEGNIDKLKELLLQKWNAISNKGGKSEIANRRSNIYCANTFPTKIRSAIKAEQEGMPLDTAVQSAVEHNRWVMEQLLTGMRPIDKTYSGPIPVEDVNERKNLKSRGIHPDLLSSSLLGSTRLYDESIVEIINILREFTPN